jgi:hypothetical protein
VALDLRLENLQCGMEASRREPLDPILRCTDCGDVIGVYEPVMHVFDQIARRTSVAAEPYVCHTAGDCYHAGCYERLFSEG